MSTRWEVLQRVDAGWQNTWRQSDGTPLTFVSKRVAREELLARVPQHERAGYMLAKIAQKEIA